MKILGIVVAVVAASVAFGDDDPLTNGGVVLTTTTPGGTFREALRDGGEGPEMVVIPAGRFRMGCLSNDDWGTDGCRSQWGGKLTAAVGSFAPNRFGLYDMHGNVWEWVEDCWNESYAGAPSDGSAWLRGDCAKRVLRGGSWNDYRWNLRAADRSSSSTGEGNDIIGFRVARTLAP